eukprot:gene148-1757_t
MLSFVKLVKPKQIIPHVDKNAFKEHEVLFREAAGFFPKGAAIPITAWLKSGAPKGTTTRVKTE